MLTCCAHHLVDLLPLVGLSAAAVFLNAYKTPLFLVGIGMNVIGIVVIARQLQRARRACAVIKRGSPAAPTSQGESFLILVSGPSKGPRAVWPSTLGPRLRWGLRFLYRDTS